MKRALFQLLIVFIFLGCQAKKHTFKSFDSDAWKAEAKDCQGYRAAVMHEMKKEFDQFIGLREGQVRQLLGAPREIGLYKRGQKFMLYDVSCPSRAAFRQQLRFRLSALNYVSEVLLIKKE